MKKKVDLAHQNYMNSEKYRVELIDSYLQNLNLKGNEQKVPGKGIQVGSSIEFLAFYKELIDLYPEKFGKRSKKLKQSLINSLYSSSHSELLKESIKKLTINNKDDFLLIPLTTLYKNEAGEKKEHRVCVIIRREKNCIKLEMFDKTNLLAAGRKMKQLKQNASKIQLVSNYIYEFNDNEYFIKQITDVLSLGIDRRDQQKKYEFAKGNVIPSLLARLSKNQGYGRYISSQQFVQGNCYIKAVSGALDYVLFQENQTNVRLSTKEYATQTKLDALKKVELHRALGEIIKKRLQNLGYSQNTCEKIDQSFALYQLVKKDRTKDTKIDYFHSKIKVGNFFNHYFKIIEKDVKVMGLKKQSYSYENPLFSNKEKAELRETLKKRENQYSIAQNTARTSWTSLKQKIEKDIKSRNSGRKNSRVHRKYITRY